MIKISKNGRKMLVYAIIVAFLISAISYTPKTAAAEDVNNEAKPIVTILGATIKLGEVGDSATAGKQSMRIGIQINNASRASECAINLKLNVDGVAANKILKITTDETCQSNDSVNVQYHRFLNSIDKINDTAVYAVVVNNIPQEHFDKTQVLFQGEATTVGDIGEVVYSKNEKGIADSAYFGARTINNIVENINKPFVKKPFELINGILVKRIDTMENDGTESFAPVDGLSQMFNCWDGASYMYDGTKNCYTVTPDATTGKGIGYTFKKDSVSLNDIESSNNWSKVRYVFSADVKNTDSSENTSLEVLRKDESAGNQESSFNLTNEWQKCTIFTSPADSKASAYNFALTGTEQYDMKNFSVYRVALPEDLNSSAKIPTVTVGSEKKELISNGSFDADANGWFLNGIMELKDGYYSCEPAYGSEGPYTNISTAGISMDDTLTMSFKVKCENYILYDLPVRANLNDGEDTIQSEFESDITWITDVNGLIVAVLGNPDDYAAAGGVRKTKIPMTGAKVELRTFCWFDGAAVGADYDPFNETLVASEVINPGQDWVTFTCKKKVSEFSNWLAGSYTFNSIDDINANGWYFKIAVPGSKDGLGSYLKTAYSIDDVSLILEKEATEVSGGTELISNGTFDSHTGGWWDNISVDSGWLKEEQIGNMWSGPMTQINPEGISADDILKLSFKIKCDDYVKINFNVQESASEGQTEQNSALESDVVWIVDGNKKIVAVKGDPSTDGTTKEVLVPITNATVSFDSANRGGANNEYKEKSLLQESIDVNKEYIITREVKASDWANFSVDEITEWFVKIHVEASNENYTGLDWGVRKATFYIDDVSVVLEKTSIN